MPGSSSNVEDQGSSQSGSTPPTRVAFLVHSVQTFEGNLPPEVDEKSLARQRRRRTSPEDQKILEEEFARNPRPDKAGRKAIVSRVSLGDKEVQIWFQNRRQHSRRKFRQEGNEIVVLSSDPSEISESFSSPMLESVTGQQPLALATQPLVPLDQPIPASYPKESQLNSTPITQSTPQSTASINVETQPTELSCSQASEPQISSQQSTGSGYLANRRIGSYVEEPPLLPRSLSSFASSYDLRLSMTADGKAKIVNRAVPSPSPEKPQSTQVEAAIVSRLGSLRRSYSAAGLDTASHPAVELANSRKLARTSTLGRSRDSRTWEFWCDSDARNSLIERAAQESSGSAAEAIGLMRSNSSRVLKLNSNKMNSPSIGHARANSLTGKLHRPALQRSSTHAGFVSKAPKTVQQPLKKPAKKGTEAEEYEQLNTESDKENWDPNSLRVNKHSQPTVARTKKALGENTIVMSQSNSFGTMMSQGRHSKSSRRKPETQIHVDAEVAGFMGGNSTTSRASSGEDLDCVQSLLSLSQGNWH